MTCVLGDARLEDTYRRALGAERAGVLLTDPPYCLLTLVGSAIWAFAIAGAGYGLGSSYERFHHDFRYAEYVVVAGVLVLAAYLVYRLTNAAKVTRRDDPAR